MHDAFDDLTGFVAFAGDQERIARIEKPDPVLDRGAPIADIHRARAPREHLGADGGRFLRTRIIIGDDHDVGVAGGDRPHFRTFARIAGPAAAEHEHDAPRRMRARGAQKHVQAVGSVRIVDENVRAFPRGADMFAM